MSELPMSEHAWCQEQIAAFVADGLEAAEVERFEAHVRDCAACVESLDRARRLDRGMSSLFALGLPGPDLEARTVLAFRAEPIRIAPGRVWPKRMLIAAGVAAVITLGGVAGKYGNGIPMPGSEWGKRLEVATGGQEPADSYVLLENLPEKDLTNQDLGLQSDLASAIPDLERVDKQKVKAAVTQDSLGQPYAPDTDVAALRLPGLADGSVRSSGVTNGAAFYGEQNLWGDNGRPSEGFAGRTGETKSILLKVGGGNARLGDSGGEVDKRGEGDKKSRSVYGNYYGATDGQPVANGRPSTSSSADSVPTRSRASLPVFQPPTDSTKVDKENSVRLGYNSTEKAVPSTDTTPNTQAPPAPAPTEAPGKTVVIKSGEIEFEIDSFDAGAATVAKIVSGIKGAFVSTVNSEKLPNGKMKGSITVRVPPEQLDGLLLDLRRELGKGGELKGSRIGAQDITKQYIDLESRLKAAKAMEQRLLEIIKNGGKGEIKGLVEAEVELGKWRTRIEEITGELRYYNNLVSLSTLTITLTERNLKEAAGITESERIQAGVEVEDVEKAQKQILDAVAEAKGRVTKSEMKQHAAGQYSAILNFEVAPEQAGLLRDRLRQIGRIARLEIDRVQSPEGAVSKTAKVQRGDTLFFVQIYNLASIPPREVTVVEVAVLDVQVSLQALREAVAKANGRVLLDQNTKQDQQTDSAHFDFEVRRPEEGPVRSALDGAGEVLSRQVSRAAESDSVTDAKVMFRTTLVAASQLKPREKATLTVEVTDVRQTVTVFGVEAAAVKGRQVDSQFTRDRAGRLTAKVVYEAPLAAAAGLIERFKSAGDVRAFQSVRDANAPEGKFATARLEVTVSNAERIVGEDEGIWPRIQRGLSNSALALLATITWVVFGLCVVVPWALIAYVVYRVIRGIVRGNRRDAGTTGST